MSLSYLHKPDLPRSAYVHVPFCRRRCYYCDFPISVAGDRPPLVWPEEYVEVLCTEITMAPVPEEPLATVFFGGGTPSLLPVTLLAKILETIEQHLGIAPGAEISLEIDPGTFTHQQLTAYHKLGINRVSLGVQTFTEELLTIAGRSHSLEDSKKAIELIREINLHNFSIDLISGLPHQTLNQWKSSLQTAINIAPHHISCYDLVLEPTTVFAKQYQPGTKPLPTDTETAKMYELADEMLTEAGYEHYEISNYAKPGYQCQHNRVYWQNQPYYGFGMGATSYVQRQRFSRPRTRQEYYTWVRELIDHGREIDCPKTSNTDLLLETLMLGLRLAEGVSFAQIRLEFGQETLNQICSCLEPYYEQGWVENIGSERFRLTAPQGFLFSNTILAALFEVFLNKPLNARRRETRRGEY